ncbi:GNAT family N-acetyltransferase [bacterium]|nr:GNAT family N-acetyltransferase [bacterium]MBU1958247.1 GNAT family N-acetyltransferase [bacterium]
MITQAHISDVSALITLENELFSADNFPLSRSSFYYHVKKNPLFIYREAGQIVGYLLWLKRKNRYRLYSLGVSKKCRGLGIAQALLTYSFERLKASSYTLEVKTINSSAIRLYKKNGFKEQKLLVNYYPNHCDGYLMVKC